MGLTVETNMKSIMELMDLRGRVALVTGATGHIGRVFCDALAEMGADIAILDQIPRHCSDAATRIQRKYQVRTLPLPTDLADENSVRAVPNTIIDKLGRLDILINCAAIAPATGTGGWAVPFEKQTSEAWRLALEVNLTAAFILIQASTEALSISGHGSVINVGSIYGMVGPDMRLYEGTAMANPAAYATSKGGLLQFTRWLATVLAPRVRVNSITPGGVWRNHPETFHDRYRSRTPLQRMASEQDFKGAAVYLASDLSAYVTGHNLVVDGGWTIW